MSSLARLPDYGYSSPEQTASVRLGFDLQPFIGILLELQPYIVNKKVLIDQFIVKAHEVGKEIPRVITTSAAEKTQLEADLQSSESLAATYSLLLLASQPYMFFKTDHGRQFAHPLQTLSSFEFFKAEKAGKLPTSPAELLAYQQTVEFLTSFIKVLTSMK